MGAQGLNLVDRKIPIYRNPIDFGASPPQKKKEKIWARIDSEAVDGCFYTGKGISPLVNDSFTSPAMLEIR